MTAHFDCLVIGGGVGGTTAAGILAAQGKRVAIVEARDWGGTTINRGSTPKRALLAVAALHHELARFKDRGFTTVPPIDWDSAGLTRDRLIMDESTRTKERLLDAGVTTLEGHATFVDAHTVMVGGTAYAADRFIIATGAQPRALTFPGNAYVAHSATLLRSHQLPAHIVILGAGIIAFALASIAAEAGAQVTVIQHDDVALRAFDQDLVQVLITQLKAKHVTFLFDQQVTGIIREQGALTVSLRSAPAVVADAVYNVTGRVPAIGDLGLAGIGVAANAHGVQVDAHLRSTVPNIWAIGDSNDAPVPKLSSYAIFQAKYVAATLTQTAPFPIKYPIPAMTVFSIPKLGQTGVLVNEAKLKPTEYRLEQLDAANWQSFARDNEKPVLLKLVIRRSDETVVGATVLSDQADTLTNYFALLINAKVTRAQLQQMIFAYPSLADDLYGIW